MRFQSFSTFLCSSRPPGSLRLLLGAALLTCLVAPAKAAPSNPVFYGSGPLDIFNDPTAGGAYLNWTYLASSLSTSPDLFLFIRGTNDEVHLTSANLAGLGYYPGDELKFYIESNEGTFYTGSDNADVTNDHGDPFSYYVSFEDQILPGDLSYHNAAFLVKSQPPVPPVPGPLPLLGSTVAIGMSRKLRQRIKSRRLPVVSAID